MANPMTAAQIKTQLTKWGVKFKEVKGWATHNRNSKGAWGGVNGFMWHHTGADVSNGATYAAGFLSKGSTALPGPLCHFGIAEDGTAYLIGWGRTNHAGGGDPKVLAKVVSEEYTGNLKPTKGNSDGVDGNAHFYGMEIMYSGSHGMTGAQYSTALKISAAICDFHGWSQRSVIGHGEWSADKWDPGYSPNKIMDMNAVRNDILDVMGKRDKNADGDTVDSGEPNAPKTPPVTPPANKNYTVKKGDTVTFPGGGKVTVN